MSHSLTDIVVPVHNALEYVHALMDMIYAHTQNFRLIIVDDHSDDKTAEYLRGFVRDHGSALYLRTGKQKWFTRASNLGIRLARTGRVLLINSDCQVNDGWLQEMHDVMDETNKEGNVGLIGSQSCLVGMPRYVETKHSEMGYVTGHCYLLNMPVVEALATKRGTPGYIFNEKDQEQVHIASDRMLCWDLNDAGYKTFACYHAAVGHHGGKSWGYDLGRISGLTLKDVD